MFQLHSTGGTQWTVQTDIKHAVPEANSRSERDICTRLVHYKPLECLREPIDKYKEVTMKGKLQTAWPDDFVISEKDF